MKDLIEYIDEGLIWSYDPNYVVTKLKEKFKIKDDDVEIKHIDQENNHEKNNKEQDDIITLFNDGTLTLNELDKFFDVMGWYFRTSQNHYRSYCPKFQHKINDKIHKNYKYLYHYTKKSKKDKILKYGLVPKENNSDLQEVFHYRNRIHLLNTKYENLNTDDKKNLKAVFCDEKGKLLKDLIEITIDISKLDINFYIDPNVNDSSYITYDNILPKYIVKIEDYEV